MQNIVIDNLSGGTWNIYTGTTSGFTSSVLVLSGVTTFPLSLGPFNDGITVYCFFKRLNTDCEIIRQSISLSSITPTPTPTFTATPTSTINITPTNSLTPSLTPTKTPEASATATITPTISMSPTLTPSLSVSHTVTPTFTRTPTQTPTVTKTPTQTPTVTPTQVCTSYTASISSPHIFTTTVNWTDCQGVSHSQSIDRDNPILVCSFSPPTGSFVSVITNGACSSSGLNQHLNTESYSAIAGAVVGVCDLPNFVVLRTDQGTTDAIAAGESVEVTITWTADNDGSPYVSSVIFLPSDTRAYMSTSTIGIGYCSNVDGEITNVVVS